MAKTFGGSDKGSDVKMYKCGERLKESIPRVKGEGVREGVDARIIGRLIEIKSERCAPPPATATRDTGVWEIQHRFPRVTIKCPMLKP